MFHAQITTKNRTQPIFAAEQHGLISKNICVAMGWRNGDYDE